MQPGMWGLGNPPPTDGHSRSHRSPHNLAPCPRRPPGPPWVRARCPPGGSVGLLGWWGRSSHPATRPFLAGGRGSACPAGPRTPHPRCPGPRRSAGEPCHAARLSGDHPPRFFLPLLLKALPRLAVSQGSSGTRVRLLPLPWRLQSAFLSRTEITRVLPGPESSCSAVASSERGAVIATRPPAHWARNARLGFSASSRLPRRCLRKSLGGQRPLREPPGSRAWAAGTSATSPICLPQLSQGTMLCPL